MRKVSIDNGRSDDVKLTVNDIELHKRDFNGKYYEGMDLRVSGVDGAGQPVTRWAVTVRQNGSSTVTNYDGPLLTVTVPAGCESVLINSVPGASGGIEDVEADGLDSSLPVEVYDLQGRSLGTYSLPLGGLNAGMYVLRQGSRVSKAVVR